MGIFGNFTSDAIGGLVEGVGTGVGNLATSIREAIKGKEADPTRLAELAAEADRLEAQARTAQAEINRAEAQHRSVFVAGWRPFIGWICGTAFAFNFVVSPLIMQISALLGKTVMLNALDLGPLLTLALGMLGIAGLRTYEKQSGIQHRH